MLDVWHATERRIKTSAKNGCRTIAKQKKKMIGILQTRKQMKKCTELHLHTAWSRCPVSVWLWENKRCGIICKYNGIMYIVSPRIRITNNREKLTTRETKKKKLFHGMSYTILPILLYMICYSLGWHTARQRIFDQCYTRTSKNIWEKKKWI